jgi:hypothetical protein
MLLQPDACGGTSHLRLYQAAYLALIGIVYCHFMLEETDAEDFITLALVCLYTAETLPIQSSLPGMHLPARNRADERPF